MDSDALSGQPDALIDSVHAGIGIADADENLTFVNSTFAEMLGYSAAEILGASLSQITTQGEFARYRALTRQRQNGLRNYYESTLCRRDGSRLDVLISASPYSGFSGRFGGTLGVVLDITLLRQRQGSGLLMPDPEPPQIRGKVVALSPAMVLLLDVVEHVAGGDANVVVEGETGTGKELVARHLHSMSPRHGGPFVPIDCGALPIHLLESELFGHERGAFTGAYARKPGLFETARGGTVFLDEVTNLDMSLQSKLLRVLQERSCRRIGGREDIELDFRLVAATNESLEDLVDAGRFRRDLYYRLNVIPVSVPPLRDRKEEISLLADHFLRSLNQLQQRQINGFAKDAKAILQEYSWPGNVRELQNAVERAFWLTREGEVIPAELFSALANKGADSPSQGTENRTLQRAREQAEHAYLCQALAQVGGNVTRAAEIAGVHRTSFQRTGYPLDASDLCM